MPQPEDSHRRLIESFWRDLYERHDFEGVGAYFAEHGRYEDVPTPDAGAVGPAAVAARLRVGLEPIEKHVQHVHRVVAEGDTVVTEHTEEWHWHTGESVALPFVSIHVIENGKIVSWRDYWDLGTLMNGAPQWWVEHIMKQAVEAGLRDPDAGADE